MSFPPRTIPRALHPAHCADIRGGLLAAAAMTFAAGPVTLTAGGRELSTPYPQIPYGWADFEAMRRERTLYVDKTRFLHELERERFAFLIRPRRFGKSCWVALLESYYDRNRSDRFDAIFGGTDIARQPTPNRHRYVILRFDFSAFDDTPDTLRERFETYCFIALRFALEDNEDLFPQPEIDRILAHPSIDGRLNELFGYTARHGIPLYVLIDEYDNFANTILADQGAQAYESFTHGGGFYRNFFATLKAGAGHGGGVERLFITGVSPITMDDVTSGFNIATNISLMPEFNELLGFTAAEVRSILATYRGHGVLDQEVDEALAVMSEWYNGYRFAQDADSDVYNTDMVLYYVKASVPGRGVPRHLIDTNVRIDYGKLRHLVTVNRQLNGNFDLLRDLVGAGWVDSELSTGFPLEELNQRDNFVSLLHYFGLLSIREVREDATRLAIPNQTVRRLMYGYLRDGYRDVGVFSVDLYTFRRLVHEMAFRGAWRPVLKFLSEAIASQTSIRDYIDGEKIVQGFLAAYLSATEHFVFHTERELGGGYADICLEPHLQRYTGMRHGYLIELKYLKRGDPASGARVAAAAREAGAQLQRYLGDQRLARQYPAIRFTGLALVFHGWQLVHADAIPAASR